MPKQAVLTRSCQNCSKVITKPLACNKCKVIAYCNSNCQKEHWQSIHKGQCDMLKSLREEGRSLEEINQLESDRCDEVISQMEEIITGDLAYFIHSFALEMFNQVGIKGFIPIIFDSLAVARYAIERNKFSIDYLNLEYHTLKPEAAEEEDQQLLINLIEVYDPKTDFVLLLGIKKSIIINGIDGRMINTIITPTEKKEAG